MRLYYFCILMILSLHVFAQNKYSVIIRNGLVYDGSGDIPYKADIGVCADTICAIGDLSHLKGDIEINAEAMAVAPGFINMLSWANETLIEDGRSLSDILQGVTLEVMGEGQSMGPLNEKMKEEMLNMEGDIKYDIKWTSFGDYFNYLEQKGISTNVASFVGATTVRVYVLGYDNRPPSPEELKQMQDLVAAAMKEGALGLGSSLIYAPAFYADKHELIQLAKTAAEYGGMYISHMRSEGNRIFEALDELIDIAKEANIPAEIYHIKVAGQSNWSKSDSVLSIIEHARASGIKITADMYTYTAAATGLDAMMPPWVQEGGLDEWIERLKTPEIRKRVVKEIETSSDGWENFYLMTGSSEKILLTSFKNDSLKKYTGLTLEKISQIMHKSPVETAIELVINDRSRVGVVYFLMAEENVKKFMQKPWVSFGSDEESSAPEGVFLKYNVHPRAYGNVARLLGKYVRDEKLISMQEAVRRLSSLPADNLKIEGRGKIEKGFFADLVVFNPDDVHDPATYDKPHQFSTGMQYVVVNGVPVIMKGRHTGATPGRFIKGPGWRKSDN